MKLIAALLVLSILYNCAWTQTIELTAKADATLIQDATGQKANSHGSYLFVGYYNSLEYRTLVKFDLTGVSSSQVAGATLKLYTTSLGVSATISLHKVTKSWQEGLSNPLPGPHGDGREGTTPTQLDVTWIHNSYDSLQWNTQGGDYNTTPTAEVTAPSVPGWVEFKGSGLVADILEWINNPSSNYGWLLRFKTPATELKVFYSQNAFGVTQKPTLVFGETTTTPGSATPASTPTGPSPPITNIDFTTPEHTEEVSTAAIVTIVVATVIPFVVMIAIFVITMTCCARRKY